VEMYARQYPRRILLFNPLSEWFFEMILRQ
jgi:hypothetical protein